MPVIANGENLIQQIQRLLNGAELFEIPVLISEQYPRGLGPTVSSLSEAGKDEALVFEKTTFSCREKRELFDRWLNEGRDQVVVTGIESHICVLQTCLDLIEFGFQVFVPCDAVGSRDLGNKEIALRRLEQHRASLTVTESVLFEWCESSTDPNFRTISQLVK